MQQIERFVGDQWDVVSWGKAYVINGMTCNWNGLSKPLKNISLINAIITSSGAMRFMNSSANIIANP